jgi:hypothetical protein
MAMFQHMIDDNEKLKDAFKEEFDVTNDLTPLVSSSSSLYLCYT